MAETISSIQQYVAGNKRIHRQKVTLGAGSATADIPTGLYRVDFAVVTPLKGSAMPSLIFNSATAGTATAGTVAFASATSAGSYLIESYEGGKES